MRRHLIGIIAIALLLGGTALWLWPPSTEGWIHQFHAACWRVGALMSVLWLAYPQVHRMPAWLWAAIPALVLVLAVRPRWFLIAVPVVIALAILKPRLKQSGKE